MDNARQMTSPMRSSARKPAQSIPVYRAAEMSVVNGANLGDAISFADEIDLDDTYELRKGARTALISLLPDAAQGAGGFVIAPDSAVGRVGATVHLDSCLTLMSANGQTTEMLILVEVDARGDVEAIYAMPLATMVPRVGYSLVGVDRDGARQRFAEVACVSFTRGTQITMASGEQRPVEALRVGDRILTRDDGPQVLRWIGQNTTRAIGDFAPIRIRAGTLHNDNDLLVSPDHRLFIYQRSDALGAGRSEVLVRARHLVNGDSVTRQTGGFIDYFQLLFDDHQIIYAEGIAAETLLVDTRTRAALPDDLDGRLASDPARHGPRAHLDFEIDEDLIKDIDAASLLRRSSIS